MTTRWVPFLMCSAILQLFVMLSLGSIPLKFIDEAQREIADPNGKVFRPYTDPRMAIMLLTQPSLCCLSLGILKWWFNVELNSISAGTKMATMLWVCTSLHGIFIDYCSYKESPSVAMLFTTSSLLCAIINGACLAKFSVIDGFVKGLGGGFADDCETNESATSSFARKPPPNNQTKSKRWWEES